MAGLQAHDKKKDVRYNQYAPGSRLSQIQKRQTDAMGDVAADTGQLLKKTFTAPVAREGLAAVANGVAGGVVDTFLPDINKNRAALNKPPVRNPYAPPPHDFRQQQAEQLATNTHTFGGRQLPSVKQEPGTAQAATVPGNTSIAEPPMMTGHDGNRQQPAAANPNAVAAPPTTRTIGTPGAGMTVNLSANDNAIKSNMEAIDQRLSGGETPTPEQAAKIQELRQQAGFLRGGTDSLPVGPDGRPISNNGFAGRKNDSGLEVSFDQSVSPEDKAAFLRKPAPPAGVVSPRQQAEPVYNGMPISVANRLGRGPQQATSANGSGKPGENGVRFTKESHPDMDYRERRALNEQYARNEAAAEGNAASLSATNINANTEMSKARLAGRTDKEVQQMRNDGYMDAAKMEYAGKKLGAGAKTEKDKWEIFEDADGNPIGSFNPATNERKPIPSFSEEEQSLGFNMLDPNNPTKAQEEYRDMLKAKDQAAYDLLMMKLKANMGSRQAQQKE